jgi:hypothetical protein
VISSVSRAFLPPSPAQCESIVASLISASGYRTTRLRRPPHACSSDRPRRPPHPAPTSVTIAKRPFERVRDANRNIPVSTPPSSPISENQKLT